MSKSVRYGLFVSLFLFLVLFTIKFLQKKIFNKNFIESIAELDTKLQTDDVFTNAYFLSKEKNNPFVDELIKKANKQSSIISIKQIDKKEIKKKIVYNVVLIVILSLYGVLFPKNFLLTGSRILLPWTDFSKNLFFLNYKILPGNKKVVFGHSENIILQSSDKIKKAILYYKGNQSQFAQEPLVFQTNNNKVYVYFAMIKDIQEDISYYIRIIGKERGAIFDSKTYSLKSVQSPLIQSVDILYTLPNYTGGKTMYQKENGNIEGLRGSRIAIKATANKKIQKSYCVINGVSYKAKVKKNKIQYNFILKSKGTYFFRLQDFDGLTNSYPVHYSIDILDDLPPEIEIVKPGKNIEIDNDMSINISIKGKDDYRIQSIQFYNYIVRGEKYTTKTNKQNLPIEQGKDIHYSFEFNLDNFDMVPGDTLFYYAQIDDGYFDHSHIVKSSIFSIKFPSLLDMYKSVDREENQHIKTLSDIVEKQKEYEKKIKAISDKLKKNKKLSFVEKQQLENLLKREKQLLKETKKLSENINKTIEKIEKNKMNSLEVIKKMREIQQLLDQIATKEMKENIEKLQKSLEKMKLTEQDKQRLSKELDQEKLLKKLDNTLKMLKELKKQRKLNNIAKKMENIVEKQRKINQKTAEQNKKNPDTKELEEIKKKQEENKNAIKDLKKSIQNFNKEYNKKNDKIKKDFQKSLQTIQSNQIQKQMDSVKQDVQNKKMQQAQQKEMKLMNDLMSLQNQLTKNIKKKQQQNLEEMFHILDNSVWNLIGISKEQRQVMNRLQEQMEHKKELMQVKVFEQEKILANNKPFSFPNLGEKEIFLKRNLLYNKKQLQSMLEKMAMLPEEFYKQFDSIANQMEVARQNLEKQNIFFSAHYVKMSYDSLNILILQIMNIKKNVKSQAQSSSQQGMSEGMQQIGKGQQQINQSTKQMMGQIGEKGMTAQQQEYMKQLAYQQQLIKQSFDDLTSGENGKKFMGDKGKISKDMKEIAEKLKKGEIDQNLIKKQNKVLKKLLDSEKSLKVKEKSKKRKAETASTMYEKIAPKNIKKGKRRKPYFNYKTLEKFPEEYRTVIEEYFKQIYKEE